MGTEQERGGGFLDALLRIGIVRVAATLLAVGAPSTFAQQATDEPTAGKVLTPQIPPRPASNPPGANPPNISGQPAGSLAQPLNLPLAPADVNPLPIAPDTVVRPRVVQPNANPANGPAVGLQRRGGALPPPPPDPMPPTAPNETIGETDAGVRVLPAPSRRFTNQRRDSTGLLPDHPPGPPPPRSVEAVSKLTGNLIETVLDPEAELSVAVGATKLIETRRSLLRIAVANPTIADVEILSDQPDSRLINLYGRSFGNTTVTFWDADNRAVTFIVRVTLDTKDLESRITQAFPGAVIHIRQVGPQVILEGQVRDSKTMSEVLQIVNSELRNSGGLKTQAGGAGGMPQGAGGAGMPGSMGGGAGGPAGMMLSANIINRVHVPGPRQVMLHVKIAELNRTAIRQLGVSWLDTKNNALLASTIGGAANITSLGAATQTASTNLRGNLLPVGSTWQSGATAANTGNLFGIFNAAQFNLFVNALRSNALAKVLAEPTLMTLDGQPARFLAGGLFPYPVPQSSSIPGGTAVVTVQFANFGAILSFLPNILANDVIRLDVEPVFSQLDFGQGTTINGGAVPAIDQRSARTVVELREGQTLAIAGLLQTRANNTTVRIPILGDIPIVGPLFSNNRVEMQETELVVLVTPELVSPMESNEVPPAPGDRVYQPNDYEFYFLGRIEGKLGREFRATVRELDPLGVMKHIASENQWVIGPHGHAD